mmetsp:Transcript_29238/g.51216  ORF Transcript_29238/g.51216 Transcript_29238/m.51216 type:complete len:118 (-) Transcript_29238:56-409(-)
MICNARQYFLVQAAGAKFGSMENLSLSVPDLLKTVKKFVNTDKHELLDAMLQRYMRKDLCKQQLQLELRQVAGRDALRQALLAMVPQIDDLQRKAILSCTSCRRQVWFNGKFEPFCS